ncbi:uncharacterized protein ColSpa_01383 [Colletotrichum spaethianum]|uniref:Uncharacterized protein n=1 Tax=Colletotrichum spaethianum TaxID=700344 RepID=A0AA37LBB1_9PEZI|nr:uncharacterized protein ColSpa_01383 [Colletotrichum spaethianum]GKT41202.1 hypothetical protein ColSpa_01383 [Colletotrichum spaethianum]
MALLLANFWNTWPGAPINSAGGNLSLRALYARYIEDTLLIVESNAATFASQARAWYQAYYTSLKADAWFNSAFGNSGWATAACAKFPRPGSGGTGWSVFGATGNPSMTVRGDGTLVNLTAPTRI